METEALATAAASVDLATLGSAAKFDGSDIFVTMNLDFMVAAWNSAYNIYWATDRGRVLYLPTSG